MDQSEHIKAAKLSRSEVLMVMSEAEERLTQTISEEEERRLLLDYFTLGKLLKKRKIIGNLSCPLCLQTSSKRLYKCPTCDIETCFQCKKDRPKHFLSVDPTGEIVLSKRTAKCQYCQSHNVCSVSGPEYFYSHWFIEFGDIHPWICELPETDDNLAYLRNSETGVLCIFGFEKDLQIVREDQLLFYKETNQCSRTMKRIPGDAKIPLPLATVRKYIREGQSCEKITVELNEFGPYDLDRYYFKNPTLIKRSGYASVKNGSEMWILVK